MGIIQRQGIKYAIVSLFGTVISAISVIYIYPKDLENYGLLQTIIGYNLIISPIIGLGFNNAIINFSHQSTKNKSDLAIVCSAFNIVLGFLIFYIGLQILMFFLPNLINQNSFLYQEKNHLFFISICSVLIGTFINFSNTLGRAVVPNLIFNVGLKIWIALIIVLLILKITESNTLFFLLEVFYFLVLLVLIAYTFKLAGVPQSGIIDRIKAIKLKPIIKYSFYNGIAGIMAILALKLDVIYISELKSYTDVAKYSLPFFMANLLELPLGGITSIMAPILAQKIRDNDLQEASALMQKAANILLLTSGGIFCLIFALFNLVISISGKSEAFQFGLTIFSIIGIAKMIDIGTGINSHVITYSKYFKSNLVLSPIIAGVNIFCTYILTKKFGIIGTSISVLLVIIIYNLLKSWILYKYIKVNAFNLNSLKIAFFIALNILFLFWVKNIHFQLFVEIAISLVVVILSYFIFIWYFKPSEEIFNLISKKEPLKNILKSIKP